MKALAELAASNEDRLMHRVLWYAKTHDYTKYTSTLAEAWRTSIAGLSEALALSFQTYEDPPEFGPDDDFAKDPIASFGILEARRHRSRGVSLTMFLGLLKYYRQSYIDMVLEGGFDRPTEELNRLYIDRFFDRIELGFVGEWMECSQNDLVDELQHANRLITNEKNKYLTIFESLANPAIILNRSNEIENMNHAALLLFSDSRTPGSYYYCVEKKIPALEWLAQELEDFVSDGKKEMVFEKDLHTGPLTRSFEVKLTPMLDVSGKFSGSIVLLNDTTQQRLAQKNIKASEERLRLVFDESPIGIGISRDGMVVYANPAMAGTFGYADPVEIVGLPNRDFICPEDRHIVDRLREDALAGKALPSSTELRGLRKSGDFFDMEVWTKPIDYRGEKSFLIFVVDTSRAKRLWKQLLQAQKMEAVGTLASGIAHDFNNMLTIIRGYGELLLEEIPESRPGYGDVHKIIHTASSGADLVRRLLMFTKNAEIIPVSVDLNRRIDGLLDLMQRTLPKMIGIELDLANDLATFTADAAQIDQLVMNLAINSADAMPDGGRLVVATRNLILDDEYCISHPGAKAGLNVALSVSDSGRGMDQQTLQRIFDPFFTTKERDFRKGTGLGLSVVQGIVEQSGGHLTCESKLGQGTTFHICFPAADPPKSADVREEKSVHPKNKTRTKTDRTVLLVDDEEPVRDVGGRILKRAGYKVLTAVDGKKALELYRREQGKISVVILDLIMPEMGGRQCLDEILKVDSNAKVLISSGHYPDGTVMEVMAAGALGFVKKPYVLKDLLDAIESVFCSERH